MRDFLRGSRISDTHFPHARIRTPRYDGWRQPPSSARFLRRAAAGEGGGEDVPPDDAGL
jgi:hypothetical protein